MKNRIKILAFAALGLGFTPSLMAGDEARYGSAGATQLLINGWGRSSGWGNVNTAGVTGVESFFMNPAGLAKTTQSEFAFSRTSWMRGTDININTFGFSQNVGKNGSDVIGVSLMSFDLGNIPITTVQQPDGGLGTYKPSFLNLGLGYAKKFTNSISGGIVTRIIQEQIPDVRTVGVCFDAGVQYATSSNPTSKHKKDDVKFGISLRNLGPDMRPNGDGLSYKALLQNGSYETTVNQRADRINLPSLINIGFSYDIRLDNDVETYMHKLTVAANYNFNAFSPNMTTLGAEYTYNNILMLRAGYNFQPGGFSYDTRNDAHTGLALGGSVQIPFVSKKNDPNSTNNSLVAVDYSYRHTNPFQGTHTFGLIIKLDNGKRPGK
jgi:hypothetical protein